MTKEARKQNLRKEPRGTPLARLAGQGGTEAMTRSILDPPDSPVSCAHRLLRGQTPTHALKRTRGQHVAAGGRVPRSGPPPSATAGTLRLDYYMYNTANLNTTHANETGESPSVASDV